MKDPREIVAMGRAREDDRARFNAEHSRVRRILEGDARAFMDLLSGTEVNPAPVPGHMTIPNLLLASGNALARRLAAVPTIDNKPLDPTKKTSEKAATTASKVERFWWQENLMSLTGYQIARWMLAYSEAPIVVRPDLGKQIPCFEERDPLSALPAETSDWRPTPHDVIFCWSKRLDVLQYEYPAAREIMGKPADQIKCYEYLDEYEWTVVACAQPASSYTSALQIVPLRTVPNRIGVPMFVYPKLVTFGARQGDFNQLLGLLANQARLTVLMLMAAERQVFPDTFISGKVIGGAVNVGPDAITQLEQGASVSRLSYNSGFQFLQEIDRLERAVRVGGSFPAQFSGETPSTLATGRGNQTLIGATVDEGIKERQQILAVAYKELLERGILIDQAGYWSADQRKTIGLRQGSGMDVVNYVPSKLPRGTTRVEYGLLSAADAAQATVMIGQKVGLGEMSLQTAREMDPFIEYPELEDDRTTKEALRKALLQGIEQQVVGGMIDPRTLTRILKEISAGEDLEEAIEKAMEEAQQAAQLAGPAAPPGFGAAPGGLQGPPPPVEQILSSLSPSGAATSFAQQRVPI